MYKVLILDDEKIVRLALKAMIDWESCGYEISGSFGNAHAALEWVKQNPPDLIISDIKIPDMDGLRFIEQARQIVPDRPVIVLTNYEDFAYAVDAIRQGVMDYVIKTDISPELLTSLVERARLRLENCAPAAEPGRSKPVGRDSDIQLLRSALRGETAGKERTLSEAYCICLVHPERQNEETTGHGADGALHNLLCEKTDWPSDAWIPYGRNQSLLLLPHSEAAAFARSSDELRARLSDFSRAYLNHPCGFILSSCFVDVASFLTEVSRCSEAIPYANYVGIDRLVTVEKWSQLIDSTIDLRPFREKVREAIDSGQSAALKTMLDEFLQRGDYRAAGLTAARRALRGIGLFILLEYYSRMTPEERDALMHQLRLCETQQDFLDVIDEAERIACLALQRREQLLRKKEIAAIFSFIDTNMENHISLAMIGKSVHMSENYVSRLFKNEAGINLIHYINTAKMERARRMFDDPENTVRSVAAALGYFEPSYFAKLFKRVYGFGPSEYKKYLDDRDVDSLLLGPEAQAPEEEDGREPDRESTL